ncbi:MAG: hypothetical protein NC416_04660 [Eubacterium sp.]|nr:hypothetical protein [Eubacterium sp.]
MRKRIQTGAGWIHTTLILALIIPLLFALIAEEQTAPNLRLYLKCLLIVLPVAATDYAADRCRTLFSYLIISALTLAAAGIAAWAATACMHDSTLSWGYLLFFLGESLFVIVSRLYARLRKKKDREAAAYADPSFQPFSDPLKEPSFAVLIYFGAVYLLALNLNSPAVCNAALFSVIVYVPVTFLYQYVQNTEAYLSLNKRTCNLPSKRIYAIGGGILAIFLLLLLALALPSLFTVSQRHYRDLRKLTADLAFDPETLLPEKYPETPGEDPMAILLAEYGEPGPAPWWIDFILQIIAVCSFLFLAILLLKKIYAVFQDFRTSMDENGDILETLQDTAEDSRKIKIPANRRRLSEKEQIRKEYRRAIRRHRKDRPAIYESPAEIEDHAGIAGNEETAALHTRYELARYGRE